MEKTSLICPECNTFVQLQTEAIGNQPITCGRFNVSRCPKCNRNFLITLRLGGVKEIIPRALPKPINKEIPKFLKSDLKEVYDCFSVNAYRATGAMARRSLERCCIDKQADGKNLQTKIQSLLDKNIITKEIKESADEVRLTGNDALHLLEVKENNDEVVSQEDAEQIMYLLEQFIQILYILPALSQKRKLKRKAKEIKKPHGI